MRKDKKSDIYLKRCQASPRKTITSINSQLILWKFPTPIFQHSVCAGEGRVGVGGYCVQHFWKWIALQLFFLTWTTNLPDMQQLFLNLVYCKWYEEGPEVTPFI